MLRTLTKTSAILAFIMFTSLSLFAQAPELMSYQAVVRNSSGDLVVSQNVGIKISILQSTITGTVVYVETHTPTTNASGLVSLSIGGGTAVTGSFSAINWSAGPYFIKTETDPEGAANYTITGTQQLLSVPYALQAKTAGILGSGDFYSASTVTQQISYGQDIPFFSNGPIVGSSVSRNSAQLFYLNDVGTYQVFFQFNVTGEGLVRLRLNEFILPNTGVTWLPTDTKVFGMATVTTSSPNSYISVANSGGTIQIPGNIGAITSRLIINRIK